MTVKRMKEEPEGKVEEGEEEGEGEASQKWLGWPVTGAR